MPPFLGQEAGVMPATMMFGAGGEGPDPVTAQLTDLMGQIRDLGQKLDALGAANPAFAPDIQAMRGILRQMIVKAAQQAPTQTGSAQALPMAGQ